MTADRRSSRLRLVRWRRGRVPVARRNLLAEPRRLIAAAGGVGMALMLVLLLDGFWAGITANVTTYEDNVGADLFIAQPGARNFYGATSTIPADTVDLLRGDPDVVWAAPIRSFLSIVELHDRKVPANVIGFVPGQPGGPWDLRSGRAPAANDEVAVGSVIARTHGLGIGDDLALMGHSFRDVGTTSDAFMVSFVFMTHAATDDLLRAPGTTSFVLARTDDPAAVRGRLGATGLAVLDRDTLARNDLALMARAYEVPIGVMRAVSFVIGSLVIALTAYSAIAEHRREYGILKAIGSSRRRLLAIAVQQTLIVGVAGLVAAAVLFVPARELITWARPQFEIIATPGNVARAVLMALVMALVAAVVPARRLATLDPATAYRGG